jgi:TPP-dependent pyruvate/acetoin dehydrogenase alpha subunit
VAEAVARLQRGEPGPFFFECLTYRLKEHVGPNEDFHLGYRSRAEAAPWVEKDCIKRLGEQLEPAQRRSIEAEVEGEIRAAFAFAEQSPFPVAVELYTDVVEC